MQAAHKAKDADLEATLRRGVSADAAAGRTSLAESTRSKRPICAAELDDAHFRSRSEGRYRGDQEKYAGFPARLKAIDDYVAAAGDLAKLKDSIDDTESLKRLLRGSGVLEFHIVVDDQDMTPEDQQEVLKMEQRLRTQGQPQRRVQ